MSSEIKHILEGKRILLLGFGREGRSSYRFLRRYFPDMPLSIADRNPQAGEGFDELSRDAHLRLRFGEDYLSGSNDFDLIIKSPGIPFDLLADSYSPDIISSQTDLFLRAYSKRVCGITGTKGKTTVTTLVHHLLEQAGRSLALSGNIGIPPFDLVPDLDEEAEVIFEMSSHQLEHIRLAPHIAVILNIFPEHLDHYKDFTAYKMAKFNISRMQAAGGTLVYNADDPYIAELVSQHTLSLRKRSFSLGSEKADAFLSKGSIHVKEHGEELLFDPGAAADMPGLHNTANMMAAILACREMGLKPGEIRRGLATYKRPEHRLEFVGTFNGMNFYNDSIATIPEACIRALETIQKVDFLILGGFDRGLEYHVLRDYLFEHPVSCLLFMGPAGKRMMKEFHTELHERIEMIFADGLNDAFEEMKKRFRAGDTCLLSPAAASYGMFRNFEERGENFKKKAVAF